MIGYVLPPILNPLLYGVVCLILEITQLSGAPNPASEPVSGWIQPIVMALVPPDPELAPEPDDEPLMPPLQASSRPPAPTATAPAPNALSRLRRPTGPTALAFGTTVPAIGYELVWSVAEASGTGLSDGLVMAFPLHVVRTSGETSASGLVPGRGVGGPRPAQRDQYCSTDCQQLGDKRGLPPESPRTGGHPDVHYANTRA